MSAPFLCQVICPCGPNGEPLACAYDPGHKGDHSWATLPTFTKPLHEEPNGMHYSNIMNYSVMSGYYFGVMRFCLDKTGQVWVLAEDGWVKVNVAVEARSL